jgi:hypothetical protein
VLEIGPDGMKNSARGQQDGYVYMGTKKMGQNSSGKRVIINDFILPDAIGGITKEKLPENLEQMRKERCRGRHFRIRYSQSRQCFLARDLGVGLGSFCKIASQAEGK